MESLPLRLLTGIATAFFEHLLAVLNHLVLLDDFLVLRTLELGERVSILCLVLLTLELSAELFSFGSLSLD